MPLSSLPIPPPPPSSGRHAITREFLHGLVDDLELRVDGVTEALAALEPTNDDARGHAEPLANETGTALRGHAKALADLHAALHRVMASSDEQRFRRVFALDGPLAAYVSRACAWADDLGMELERRATLLRRLQPASSVFPHRSVSATYAEFETIATSLRRAVAASAAHDLEAPLEEMFWAVEWLHMGLARVERS